MRVPLLSKKECKVFMNASFDPRAIALRHETQGCSYCLYLLTKVFLSGHIYLQRKPLFGKNAYIYIYMYVYIYKIFKVQFQECGKYFYSYEILNIILG